MNKIEMANNIDEFFDKISEKPEELEIDVLVQIIESIIPVHVRLDMDNRQDIDALLAIYPYLNLKLSRLVSYFIHKVRTSVRDGNKDLAVSYRSYKDGVMEMQKACQNMQDMLSRRITVEMINYK